MNSGGWLKNLRVMERLTAYGETVRVLEDQIVRKDERHFLSTWTFLRES